MIFVADDYRTLVTVLAEKLLASTLDGAFNEVVAN